MFAGAGSGLCSSQARGCSPAPKANNGHCCAAQSRDADTQRSRSGPQNAKAWAMTPQREHKSWQHLAQHPRTCPQSAGVSLASPHGDTAQEPCVIPPAGRNAQGIQPTQLSHDKQTQSPRLDVCVLGNPLVSKLVPFVISPGEVQGVLRLRDCPELVTPGSESQGHKDV